MFDHAGRLKRLQELMGARGVATAMFSVGPDLPYLTGYDAVASERLTMLVVPADGDPTLVIPRLEAPRVTTELVDLAIWNETDDPVALVATMCRPGSTIAIGDHTWAVFLARLLERVDARWIPGSELTREIRVIKDADEIAFLRAAASAVDRVLGRVPKEVGFRGRTEKEVAADLMTLTVEEGHDKADFAIVASGPNGASPHHDPDDRRILDGDVIVCDFGGVVAGYHSDVTRTFVAGEPTAEAAEVHALVESANAAGRGTVAPGIPCQEVDRATRTIIADAGYGGFFVHRTGHGIGLEVHEHPYIVEGNRQPLEPGMAFSVEPGIYLPGRFGVRIEDIVIVTDDGVESLNRAPRDLVNVD